MSNPKTCDADEISRLRNIIRSCVHGAEMVDIGNCELIGLYLPNKGHVQVEAQPKQLWPKEIRSLVNEIAGVWDAFEIGLRQEISNTNYAVVRAKLTAVETLLASQPSPAATAERTCHLCGTPESVYKQYAD